MKVFRSAQNAPSRFWGRVCPASLLAYKRGYWCQSRRNCLLGVAAGLLGHSSPFLTRRFFCCGVDARVLLSLRTAATKLCRTLGQHACRRD